jgi:hypothetical protein
VAYRCHHNFSHAGLQAAASIYSLQQALGISASLSFNKFGQGVCTLKLYTHTFGGAEASLRFHWVDDVSDQSIDWRNYAVGTLDHSHWVIRSDQFWEVFENGKPVTGIISLRTGIETGALLESIRKWALR